MNDTTDNITAHNNRQWGKRLAFILSSEKVSDDFKTAISNILFNAFGEANLGLDDAEFIEMSYPYLLDNMESEYYQGVHESITSIVEGIGRGDDALAAQMARFNVAYREAVEAEQKEAESPGAVGKILAELIINPGVPDEIKHSLKVSLNDVFNSMSLDSDDTELDDFEDFSAEYNALLLYKYAAHKKQTVDPPSVLDLSAQPENLNLLAENLSNALKNPAIPDTLYRCISDYLDQIPVDTESPEWILGNLKIKAGGDGE